MKKLHLPTYPGFFCVKIKMKIKRFSYLPTLIFFRLLAETLLFFFLGLMMLVHPIKTVVLDVFGTGKTQIAVKMSGA